MLGGEYMVYVYTNYIGRYTTNIMVNGEWVYQCDGLDLDLEGTCLLFNLSRKHEVVYDYEVED